jgi:hypothetical protein
MGTPNPPRGVKISRCNAPSRIRTWGLLLRRESLYPAELSGLADLGLIVPSGL